MWQGKEWKAASHSSWVSGKWICPWYICREADSLFFSFIGPVFTFVPLPSPLRTNKLYSSDTWLLTQGQAAGVCKHHTALGYPGYVCFYPAGLLAHAAHLKWGLSTVPCIQSLLFFIGVLWRNVSLISLIFYFFPSSNIGNGIWIMYQHWWPCLFPTLDKCRSI